MSTFIQIHTLTAYPPANLNRDDMNRPKTVRVGDVQRLRVSSQSLKRAWRTSAAFNEAMVGHVGVRTKELGVHIFKALEEGKSFRALLLDPHGAKADKQPVGEKPAREIAKTIAAVFGALKKDKPSEKKPTVDLEIEQLVFVSPAEIDAIDTLVEESRESGKAPDLKKDTPLRRTSNAADIAMFGRMLADRPVFNVEAAVQVGHAFSVNRVDVEDDFYTAVDDLNTREENVGAGHMGVTEYGAGLFYVYICINRDLLVANLDGDEDLAKASLRALVEAACTVAPTGKQAAFASRANAAFVLAEKGDRQPRSLALAFLDPIGHAEGLGMIDQAAAKLREIKGNMDQCYGYTLDAAECYPLKGEGSMQAVYDFVGA